MSHENILKSNCVQVTQLPFVVQIQTGSSSSDQQAGEVLPEFESPIFSSAPEESDASVETAQAAAAKLLQAAEQEAAEIKRTAHTEGAEAGQAQGYEEGYAQGRADGEAEAREILAAARRFIGEVRRRRSEMILNSESTIIRLVTDVAERLFGNGFRLPTEQLHAVVSQTLEHARNLTNLKVHLHPEDAARLQPLWTDDDIALIHDDEIEPGGCLIVGNQGEVDARVSVQLEHINETLSATAETA